MAFQEGSLLHAGCLISSPKLPNQSPSGSSLAMNSEGPAYQWQEKHGTSGTERDGSLRLEAIIDLQGRQLESLERQMTRLNASFDVDAEDSLQSFIVQQCQKLEVSFARQIQEALGGTLRTKAPRLEVTQNGNNSSNHAPPLQLNPKTVKMPRASTPTTDHQGDAVVQQPIRDGYDQPRSFASSQTVPEGETITKEVMWEIGELEKKETQHSWYSLALERKLRPKSGLHEVLVNLNLGAWLPNQRPDNFLVHFADLNWFHVVTVLVIVANTLFTAYCADQSVRKLLQEPPESLPEWWDAVDLGFTAFFVIELIIRLVAFRLWFFMDPGTWRWNIFDLFLCTLSLISANADFLVLRLLRIFRIVRMIRVLVESKALIELRKLLLAVAACIVPLFWATLFVAMTMSMFSIFILQGIASKVRDHYDKDEFLGSSRELFYGIDGCFKTLFTLVAGPDWLLPHDILSQYSMMLAMIMPIFVVFTNIGVMNIVIGVFADASSGSKDRNAIAAQQVGEVEDFCQDMIDLLSEFSSDTHQLCWREFKQYFYREDIQAYLAYHGLDTSHVQLIFSLIDTDRDGVADIHEFIIGMLRLKGNASGLNQRVMMHGIKALAQDMVEIQSMLQTSYEV